MSVTCIPHCTPLLYSKTGDLFFLFFLRNKDCGYSLEPPCQGGSNVYPQSLFCAIIRKISNFFLLKNIKIFLLKNFNFYNLRKICILHVHVFVMQISTIGILYVSCSWTHPANSEFRNSNLLIRHQTP